MDWAVWRTIKIYLITAALIALVGGVYVGLKPYIPDWLPDPKQISTDVAVIPNAKRGLAAYPVIATIIGLALFAWPLHRWLSHRIHDRWLASFNHDVLTSIDLESNIDAESREADRLTRLPWIEATSASEAKERLSFWLAQGGEAKRRTPFRSPYRGKPLFSIAILAGRSGSGKSRLAGRLALEVSGQVAPPGQAESSRRSSSFMAWLRRSMPLLRPLPGDPWDSAVLRHRKGLESFGEYCQRLINWTPRRPTLLVLDDPAAGEVELIRTALSAAAANFRHPVHLLIVNQTITTPFTYDPRRGWMFDGVTATPPPVTLPPDRWLSSEEALSKAFTIPAVSALAPPVKKELREKLYQVSGGNPLIVELALDWIIEKGSLAGVTHASLRAYRAERILSALRVAGVSSDADISQLVIATLAGGADSIALAAALNAQNSVIAVAPIDAAKLHNCFPSDPLSATASGGSLVPPVRPDMIAHVFADYALSRIMPDDGDSDAVRESSRAADAARAEPIVLAALHLNPVQVMRQLTRFPKGGPVGAALSVLDPERIKQLVTPFQWAQAMAEAAMWAMLDDPETWTSRIQAQREEDAIAAIDGLGTTQEGRVARLTLATWIAQSAAWLPEDEGIRQFLPNAAFRLLARATEPDGVLLDPIIWIELLEAWAWPVKIDVPKHTSLLGLGRSVATLTGNVEVICRLFRAVGEADDALAMLCQNSLSILEFEEVGDVHVNLIAIWHALLLGPEVSHSRNGNSLDQLADEAVALIRTSIEDELSWEIFPRYRCLFCIILQITRITIDFGSDLAGP